MQNQIEIAVNTDQLKKDFPNGGSIPPADDNTYFSYSVLNWNPPKNPARAVETNGIWTITIPGNSVFTWYAVPQGQPISNQDITLNAPIDSKAFKNESKGPTDNSYQCKTIHYKPDGGDSSGCTLVIVYMGNTYTWDPVIIIDEDPN